MELSSLIHSIVTVDVKSRCFLITLTALLLTFTLLISTTFLMPITTSFSSSSLLPCSLPTTQQTSSLVSNAVLHYATTTVRPQQSRPEIGVTLDALRARGGTPCNLLVYGLGHDSLMWAAFNAAGATLFLEEDPKWVKDVLRDAPELVARTVRYPTRLRQADHLLATYRDEPLCLPPGAHVKGNRRCPLSLPDLPEEAFGREWDMIMIDAPRGYFAQAPGRMGAIWSSAVMARNRKGEGYTDVFLHDVDRKVEKTFALEFLCKKYLVKEVQRLWHFRIPPVREDGNSTVTGASDTFC